MSYYTGSDIILRFLVKDNNDPITPTSVIWKVLKPDDSWLDLGEAYVEDNKIYAVIPKTATTLVGKYMGLFNISLPGGLTRQHKILVSVLDSQAWLG